jgi:hypothetical protein
MPRHVFQPGNTWGRNGRPKGVRNKFDSFAYECTLAHIQHNLKEPAPAEYATTNLWRALEVTLRQSPAEYVRRVGAMLPKQVSFEHTSVAELPDDWLEKLIDDRRAELKLIELKPAPEIPEMSVAR